MELRGKDRERQRGADEEEIRGRNQRRKGTGGSHAKGTQPEHGLYRREPHVYEGMLTYRWLHGLGYHVFPLPQHLQMILPNVIFASDWGQYYGLCGPVPQNAQWFNSSRFAYPHQPIPKQPPGELPFKREV